MNIYYWDGYTEEECEDYRKVKGMMNENQKKDYLVRLDREKLVRIASETTLEGLLRVVAILEIRGYKKSEQLIVIPGDFGFWESRDPVYQQVMKLKEKK